MSDAICKRCGHEYNCLNCDPNKTFVVKVPPNQIGTFYKNVYDIYFDGQDDMLKKAMEILQRHMDYPYAAIDSKEKQQEKLKGYLASLNVLKPIFDEKIPFFLSLNNKILLESIPEIYDIKVEKETIDFYVYDIGKFPKEIDLSNTWEGEMMPFLTQALN